MNSTREELLEAFKFFDKDGKGYLTISEFKNVLSEMGGLSADDPELHAFISLADPKSEGSVYYEPLIALIIRSFEAAEILK